MSVENVSKADLSRIKDAVHKYYIDTGMSIELCWYKAVVDYLINKGLIK